MSSHFPPIFARVRTIHQSFIRLIELRDDYAELSTLIQRNVVNKFNLKSQLILCNVEHFSHVRQKLFFHHSFVDIAFPDLKLENDKILPLLHNPKQVNATIKFECPNSQHKGKRGQNPPARKNQQRSLSPFHHLHKRKCPTTLAFSVL